MRAAALVLLMAGAVGADASLPSPSPELAVFLARWLAAQNRGDFGEYQKLYADSFTGVRRSGDKVVELDRAGWMKDRARMFKRPMLVRADRVGLGNLEIHFVQSWTSGSYHDVGKKRLQLARGDSGLVIVREEMLSSGKADRALVVDCASSEYVKRVERGREFLIVKKGSAEDEWSVGLCRGTKLLDLVLLFGGEPEVKAELVELRPREFFIGITTDESLCGECEDSGGARATTSLYRVAGDRLQKVFSFVSHEEFADSNANFEDGTSGYEEYRWWVEPSRGKLENGFYQLILTKTNDDHRKPRRTRYRWTGTTYEELP